MAPAGEGMRQPAVQSIGHVSEELQAFADRHLGAPQAALRATGNETFVASSAAAHAPSNRRQFHWQLFVAAAQGDGFIDSQQTSYWFFFFGR